MLRLLLGRARTGKSARVLREIERAGRETPEARQILLVPEHASHVAEVDVCRTCGDAASRHAEVLTFKLLGSRVLSIVGGSADVTLDAGGKLLTLQRALQELAPALKVYGKPSRRSAFLKGLLDVMEELIAYAVEPERLADTAAEIPGETGDKLRDIALVYGVYLAKLHTEGRDARDRLEKLEEHLEESGYIDGKDLYFDGFSYFTGREIRILRIMLRRARSVTVTLLGDDSDRELFRESLRVREQLVREARDAAVPCEVEYLPPRETDSALSHVERHFFGERAAWEGDCGDIRVLEAPNAYAEVENAAAEILRLVREEGFRFRDITLTARNLSAYETTVETIFTRYGIPLYSARRSDILQQPVTALVLGALDAATGGFEYEDVFCCLKTGFAGLTAEECDLLENYALTWDIRGQMWVRDTAWTAHPAGYGLAWDEPSQARLDAVNELRGRVRAPFARLYEGLRGDTAREKVAALYGYLEDVKLPEALEEQTRRLFETGDAQRSEETAQLWTILCGVLDQFVEILGDSVVDGEEFARLMRLILTQYSVGTIPAALDRVNLSEMTRNDRHTVRALFLLGATDGVLPAVESGGGVLREEERSALEAHDIRLAPYGMAVFHLELQNLYAALAQPTQRLYVSYPVFDAAGAALRPSFAVGRLQTLCPGVTIDKISADKEYRLSAIKPALEYAGEHIDGSAWQWFAQDAVYASRLAAMRDASRYRRGRLSPEAVRALYGRSITLSASRIDKARACHFAYFMQYGLHARERGAAGFDAPQMGTFVHDVMEHTLRAARDEGGIKELSKERLRALTREAVAAYINRELPDLNDKTARFRYLFRRLVESTYRIMDEVADELRESDFEPLAFELSFGADANFPAISLQTERGGTVRVVGQVDRVDGWLMGDKLYLRVVDYKTGKKSFDLAELRYGLGVQMLLYLFALEREGRDVFGGHEIAPAGVLYTPARDEILRLPRGADDETVRREALKTLRRSGMVLNDTAVLKAMEHSALEEPHRLPITVKTDKDGNVSLGGSLATAEQLGKLSKYVDKLLRDIGREAERGNIDADPYVRTPQETACTYCPYAAACGFEPGRGGDHYEYIAKTGTEEFWNAIDASIAERGETDG
ncbi:MAG: PD-(D/E)XK nuclease family protein [Oscillospiraceae bacterium]|nr:PD-(D/E)XK nuclease family protein [Oscillospiraceae bacterium]